MAATGQGEGTDDACPASATVDVVALVGVELAAIRGCLKRLQDVPWARVGAQDLVDLTADVETTLRSGFGLQVRLAGQIHTRDVACQTASRSGAHLLHELLGITVGQARGRIAAAGAALPSRTLTGQVVEPSVPQLAEVIDAGQMSEEHTRVITDCLSRIPAAVDPATRALCRETLLDQATQRDPIGLRKVAEQIRLICDPDGSLTHKDPIDRAELHIGGLRRDGLTPIRGLLDPLTVEQLRVAVEALSAPAPIDERTPDPRPAAVRRAHAFSEVLRRYLATGAGPRDGGVRPQVVVTIGASDLAEPGAGGSASGHGGATGTPRPDGPATDPGNPGESTTAGSAGTGRPDASASGGSHGTGEAGPDCGRRPSGSGTGAGWFDFGGPVSAAVARLLACHADLIAQRVGADGEVLDQGRAVRLCTAAQRRALNTRDRGCAFPNCDIPSTWCESHHIDWWSNGGPTDLANGVLLCRRHHSLIHQGEWHIEPADHHSAGPPGAPAAADSAPDDTMAPNEAAHRHEFGRDWAGDRGRPWFIPPRHIDRNRAPRRNTHFHMPEALNTVRRT